MSINKNAMQAEWMRLLYEITSQENANLDRQLERALELTVNLLNLDVGIISKIESETYKVEYFYPSDNELEKGQEFELGDTYCSITLEEDRVLAIDHMKGSPYERHPCYEVFHLESYIGISLHVDQELYGTLNFSSSDTRNREFTDQDKRFIQLLGEWVEGIIKRKKVEEQNREQRENITAIIENTESLIWSIDDEYHLLTFNSSYNEAVQKMIGRAAVEGEEVLSHESTQVEKNNWKKRYDKVLSSGESTSFIDTNKSRRGTTVFGVSLYPIKDEKSEIVGVSGFAKDITQEQQLENQINKFFDLSLDLMAIATTDGYFQQVNPAFEKTLGFTQEEMTSKPAMRFVHPKDVEQSKEVTARLAQGEQTINYTNRCLCKDGTYKWISWKAEADLANGLIYATGRDVTQETEIREQLKFREERYGLAIAGASAGIWDWFDVNEDEQWWSPVYYELLGYEDQEIEASVKSYKKLIHPDDDPKTIDLVQQHFENREPFETEYRLKTKSGEYRWFLGTGQADFDEDGNPTRMVGTIIDIEDRKRLETLLHDTQEMVNVGGWEYDIESGHLLWTDEVYRIHELPVGTKVKVEDGISYYAPEARPIIQDAIEKAVETGTGWDLEMPVITEKGNEKWVRAIGKVHEKNGEVFKLSGTFQDLTQRKRMEDELVEAKEQADTANKAKSQFIANMSHEIRTPMNAILGFAELLQNRLNNGVNKNYVENIYTSGKNLLNLINDILDLSKIESGKQEIQLQAVNTRRMIHEMRDMFSIKAKQKGIEIKTEIDDHIPESLLMDEVRIRQILLNLIGNAIKFTDKGYVKIEASAEPHEVNDSMVHMTFSVHDTGIGIKEEKKEAIFEEFEQQDFTISEQYGGTGLGLSISKKLVAMMNGEISVKSTLGKGSTFKVRIPDVTIASVVEPKDLEQIDWNQQKLNAADILVVDDIEINRRLVIEYLKDQPLHLLQAQNGLEAVELAGSQKPDLILMDIKMPGMSGVEAMQKIKERHDIVVVALTASGFKGFEEKTEELGFDAYLRKPVTRKQLIKEIAKFIGMDEEKVIQQKQDATRHEMKNTSSFQTIAEMDEADIESLLHELNKKILPAREAIDLDAMIMSEYESFAEMLEKVGSGYGLDSFKRSAKNIQSAATLFDVEEINNQFKKLDDMFAELQDVLSNELKERNA